MPRPARQESQPTEPIRERIVKLRPPGEREFKGPDAAPKAESSIFTMGEIETFFAEEGKEVNAVAVGEVEESRVYAFNTGQLIAKSEREQTADKLSERNRELLNQAFDRTIDVVIAPAGLSDAEEAIVRETLQSRRNEILLGAGHEDASDAAVVSAMRAEINTDAKLRGMLTDAESRKAQGEMKRREGRLTWAQSEFARAQQEVSDLEEKLNKKETAEDLKAFQQAVNRLNASQHLVTALRLELHPEATPAQKTEIALEAKGAVQPQPDALYDEGIEAVRTRVQELKNQMRAADKTKDEVAWTIARDEFDRHMVMMPILDQANQIEAIDRDIEGIMNDILGKQKQETKMERSRVRAKRSYWRKMGEAVSGKVQEYETNLAELQKEEDFFKDFAIEHDIPFDAEKADLKNGSVEVVSRYKQALETVKNMNITNDLLKSRGVEIVLDEDTQNSLDSKSWMRSSRETGLIGKLNDLYASDSGRTRSVVERLLKSGKTRDATKNLLQGFLDGLDKPNEEEAALGNDLEAAFAEFENKPASTPSNLEENLGDDFDDINDEKLGAHPLVDVAETPKATSTTKSKPPANAARPTSASNKVTPPAPKKKSWKNGWGLW